MNWLSRTVNPSRLLIIVFIIVGLVGTLLLKLPIATTEKISWLDALFTSISAVTVTGLVVVDTGIVYTLFGQLVILTLIQIGGLGIMSFAVLMFMLLGRKIGFKERLVVQQSLNQASLGGIISLVKKLFIFSFTIEFFAMMILAMKWIPNMGFGKGLYFSFFHSISAFNNAGFSLWSDSLMREVGSPVVNIVISLLFILGGIGFTVLVDMWSKKSFKKFSLHTKLMLVGTVGLNIFAMFLFFLLEFNNPGTLGPLSLADKWWASYFQSVSPRTAGFNSIDIGAMEEPSIFFMIALMFIGAGSASTGGGIKLTTFIIIILTIGAFLKSKKEITLGRRTVGETVIFRSMSITTLSALVVFGATFMITLSDSHEFLPLLFEVVSAFGTVGLSMGITADLSAMAKWIVIFVMMIGKLGPLTLAFSLATSKQSKIKYPNEDVLTG